MKSSIWGRKFHWIPWNIVHHTHNSKIIHWHTIYCNLKPNLKLFYWLRMALKLPSDGVERKTGYVGLSTAEELLFFHYSLTLFSWNHPRIGRQRFKYCLKQDLEIPSDIRWSIEKVRCYKKKLKNKNWSRTSRCHMVTKITGHQLNHISNTKLIRRHLKFIFTMKNRDFKNQIFKYTS